MGSMLKREGLDFFKPFTPCSIGNQTSYWNFEAIAEIAKQEKSKSPKSKKDKVIELFQQGKSRSEITKELSTHYSYVHQIISKYKKDERKKD